MSENTRTYIRLFKGMFGCFEVWIFWEFFLIRCEVKGQGCRMPTDESPLRQMCNCDFGLKNELNVN